MESREDTAEWQATCPCGWRGHGTKDVLVVAVQEHSRATHARELTPEEVMEEAVRTGAP